MDFRTTGAASLGYAQARPATRATAQDSAVQAAQSFAEVLQQGEATAVQALSGKADPQALVQALAQTELAVEAAVTIRNKVVEAYQEILRMPV